MHSTPGPQPLISREDRTRVVALVRLWLHCGIDGEARRLEEFSRSLARYCQKSYMEANYQEIINTIQRTVKKFPNEFEVTKLRETYRSGSPIEIVRSLQLCDHPQHVMLRVHAQ